nr:MAG TPA: hypothetical protein [Caudoviricetes sp.]
MSEMSFNDTSYIEVAFDSTSIVLDHFYRTSIDEMI